MKLPIKNVKFKRYGESLYILIPKHYINNGLIEEDKEYDLEIDFNKK